MGRGLMVTCGVCLGLMGGGSGATAAAGCADPEAIFAAPAWRQLAGGIESLYLEPRGLALEDLSASQLGKILGHALGRQAHHVGSDQDRRDAFECLRLAAEAGLEDGLAKQAELMGHLDRQKHSDLFARTLQDAIQGFYDDEILQLTGVGADAEAPSVFEDLSGLFGPSPPGGHPSPGSQTTTPTAPPLLESPTSGAPSPAPAPVGKPRCRFTLDPALFSSAKPDHEWYLIRKSSRDGYLFDTWRVDPGWPADHSKRAENRLKKDQEIVFHGAKRDLLLRVEELQATCR